MGIDAIRKWQAEGFNRPWPAMIEMDRATKARVDALWAKLGLYLGVSSSIYQKRAGTQGLAFET
jgi:hypothetical protein